jgi:putative DNA primase/helicase
MADPTDIVRSQYDYEHVDGEVLEGEVVDDESKAATASITVVPAPTNPLAVARAWLKATGNVELIKHHRNTFYTYTGTSWPEAEDRRLIAELYGWLENAWYWKRTSQSEDLVPFEPSRKKMGDLLEALAAATHLGADLTAPAWLDDEGPDVIPMANGLLELPDRTLHPHTPSFFSQHVLPFDYDEDAPYPSGWLQFLEELWGDEQVDGKEVSSPDTLAEIMGLIISGDTSLQKIVIMVGPKRSGKGTVGRVMTGLLGDHNIAAPTLSGMCTNFGLQELIGKPLAIISDARLGTRSDSPIAVERLLSISGEDSLTIDRKYKAHWTGRLPTRFVILTNEVPRFLDASGALASRFVVLVTTASFYGREDPALTDKLLTEAPGILNWALDGLDRLRRRGHFVQPPSARDALRRLEDLSSPVGAFVRDRCKVGLVFQVAKDDLWQSWKAWCLDEGRDKAGTKAVFARDLIAAYPSIRAIRPGTGKDRTHAFAGIGLRPAGDDDDDDGDDDPGGAAREDRAADRHGVEQQWDGPLTTPDVVESQGSTSGVGDEQDRRSDRDGRGRQGSSALYPPQETTPDPIPDLGIGPDGQESTDPADLRRIVRETLEAHAEAGAPFTAAAFELNALGVVPPPGRAAWTGAVVQQVLDGQEEA